MNKLIQMDIRRFANILNAYGGHPRHWPVTEREAALALLARSPEAAKLQTEALTLDALLDEVPAVQPRPALRAAVLADRIRVQRSGRTWQECLAELFGECFTSLPARRMAATLLAASFLCGLALGVMAPATSTSTAASEVWSGSLVAEIYTGY